jgi:hypothetical protein
VLKATDHPYGCLSILEPAARSRPRGEIFMHSRPGARLSRGRADIVGEHLAGSRCVIDQGSAREATAYHESGHGKVAWYVGVAVKTINIIPDGDWPGLREVLLKWRAIARQLGWLARTGCRRIGSTAPPRAREARSEGFSEPLALDGPPEPYRGQKPRPRAAL